MKIRNIIGAGFVAVAGIGATACQPSAPPPPPVEPPARVTLTVTIDRDVDMGATKTELRLRAYSGCDVQIVEDRTTYVPGGMINSWTATRAPETSWRLLAGSQLEVSVPGRKECWGRPPNVWTRHDGREFDGPWFFVDVPYDDGFSYGSPSNGDPFQVNDWRRQPSGDMVTKLKYYDGLTVVK